MSSDLDGEIGQVGNAHSVEGLGQVGKIFESRRIGLRFGVFIITDTKSITGTEKSRPL